MFIEDKKADYRKKYPAMDDNELRRFMVKEFNCISERDKVWPPSSLHTATATEAVWSSAQRSGVVTLARPHLYHPL